MQIKQQTVTEALLLPLSAAITIHSCTGNTPIRLKSTMTHTLTPSIVYKNKFSLIIHNFPINEKGNFKKANKNLPDLEKYLDGIKIAKPAIILGGIYYIIIPLISTFIADRTVKSTGIVKHFD